MDWTNGFLRQQSLRAALSATRAEQFSLWALRLWWGAFPELQLAWADFLHGFRVCGVPSAVESCHRFCSIVLAGSRAGSGVACVHFPHILATEEQLLAALAASSRGDVGTTERLLRHFVPAAAARLAAPQASHYAQILANAGLEWPQRATSASAARLPSFASNSVLAFSERVH